MSAEAFPLPIDRTDFDPETVTILAAAYEDAWQAIATSGSAFAKPRYEKAAREIVARRILDQAMQGERDRIRLRDDAVAYLARSYKSGEP